MGSAVSKITHLWPPSSTGGRDHLQSAVHGIGGSDLVKQALQSNDGFTLQCL